VLRYIVVKKQINTRYGSFLLHFPACSVIMLSTASEVKHKGCNLEIPKEGFAG